MHFPKLDEQEGGKFLKLKNGESAVGVLRGEIFSFKQNWKNGKAVIIDESNPAKHNRFMVNFIVKEKEGYIPKTFGFGVGVYNTFADIAAEMKIQETKIKILRKGEGLDTEWSIIPLGPVDASVLKSLDGIKLNILGHHKASNDNSSQQHGEVSEPPWGDEPSMPDSEELPF